MNIAERSRRIGFVMQNPNQMISHHMIREEVGFGLRLKGIDEVEIDERVDGVLRLCDLYRFRNWPISALSYGQRKRVTIASILIMEPELLILDEPTAGQDYRRYGEIMDFLKELNRNSGLTLIFNYPRYAPGPRVYPTLDRPDRRQAVAGRQHRPDLRRSRALSREQILN